MKKMKKGTVLKILNIISGTMLLLCLLAFVLPVFVCDQFKIGGVSMNPVLESGDHILVNKLLMGARIYRKYDFSDPDMECFRMPGMRRIRPGDVAVFNYPFGNEGSRIEFRINYVYAKRCIGVPGDTVSIEDGYYRNSRVSGLLGSDIMQNTLSSTADSVHRVTGVVLEAFPFVPECHWTIRDFGPLYIPGKGDRIAIDTTTARLYSFQIEYETGCFPELRGNKVYLSGELIEEYEFRSNWYFLGGDNVLNSKDSRYVGLVPEDYIVGIATRVCWSRNPYSGKFRWNRFLKSI